MIIYVFGNSTGNYIFYQKFGGQPSILHKSWHLGLFTSIELDFFDFVWIPNFCCDVLVCHKITLSGSERFLESLDMSSIYHMHRKKKFYPLSYCSKFNNLYQISQLREYFMIQKGFHGNQPCEIFFRAVPWSFYQVWWSQVFKQPRSSLTNTHTEIMYIVRM